MEIDNNVAWSYVCIATFAKRAWETRTWLSQWRYILLVKLDYISIFILESCLYTAKANRLLYVYIYEFMAYCKDIQSVNTNYFFRLHANS